MTRKPVRSSTLASVGYDPSSMILEIEFKNGGIYQYLHVPATVHLALIVANSKGRYFAANIRDRYATIRVR
jgi:hypothetical protein